VNTTAHFGAPRAREDPYSTIKSITYLLEIELPSRNAMKRGTLSVLALGVATLLRATWALAAHIEDVTYLPNDHPAIQYAQQPSNDAVAELAQRIQSGAVKLDYAPGWGYLPAVLKQLGVHIDSQILVFSKTSFQSSKISPRAPRALYFNDEVAVGSVQGGDVLEFVALDSRQGDNFYTMDIQKTEKPEFDRRDVCFQCHQGLSTLGVPGIMVTSVYPGADGMPAFRGAAMITDHRSSFDQRWGGWYVTGTHGSQHHIGNALSHNPAQPQALDTYATQNLTSLDKKFDTSRYLAPTSDIVALMTLEHQTRMTNLMTRLGWDTRIAVHDGKLDDAMRDRIYGEVEDMVTYMLFADEKQLSEPVQGVSTFTKTFPERGPRDRQGRSLRDFDLEKRLFRYPLSYMVYSAAFDAMPDLVKERVYRRLYEVLTGKDESASYARLSPEDRRAVFEIFRETKPHLPDYWTAQ